MSAIDTKRKSLARSLCVFALIVFIRIFIKDKAYAETGMLCLNIIAFDYVLLDIFLDAYAHVKNRLNGSYLPALSIKSKLRPLIICALILFIVLLCLEFAYISKWTSPLNNDILTIITLFSSIESSILSDYIATLLLNIYGF